VKIGTVARALVTDDVVGLRALDVVELDGVLVEAETLVPVDLVSLVVVVGLDELVALAAVSKTGNR